MVTIFYLDMEQAWKIQDKDGTFKMPGYTPI